MENSWSKLLINLKIFWVQEKYQYWIIEWTGASNFARPFKAMSSITARHSTTVAPLFFSNWIAPDIEPKGIPKICRKWNYFY